jgi:hypothetical protein
VARIDDDLRELLECGVAIVIGTQDGACVPEIARGWGLHVLDDRRTVEVCVGMPSSARTLENLARNGRIAVTCVRPTNYRQVQLKGREARALEPTPEDVARVESHRAAFAQEVDHVGIAAALAPGFWEHDTGPLVKVRFAVEDAYDQTPGPQAGRAL